MGLFFKMWDTAIKKNDSNILDLLEYNPQAKLVDLGCYRGWTINKLATKVGTNHVYGCDVDAKAVAEAREHKIDAVVADLNKALPYADNFFDVVYSNQVIEHLNNVDQFIDEMYRITKPGGYVITSTENLASWHNIGALLLSQQPFSQHISRKYNIGNKLSPHYRTKQGQEIWCHQTVFTTFSLQEIFIVYGFQIEKVKGAGYHPLFGPMASLFSRIDSGHSHFITVKARKPVGKRVIPEMSVGPNIW